MIPYPRVAPLDDLFRSAARDPPANIAKLVRPCHNPG